MGEMSGCPDGRTALKVQSREMSGRNIYSEQQTNLSDEHTVLRYSTQLWIKQLKQE